MSEPASLVELRNDNPVLMAEVIAGLVQGRGAGDIAETLGIDRKRITRWYRDSETFRDMLAEVQSSIIAKIQAEVVAESAERMTNLLPAAVDTLKQVLDPSSEAKTSEKLAAAAHVMRFAGLGAKKEAVKAGPSPEDLIRGDRGPATGD